MHSIKLVHTFTHESRHVRMAMHATRAGGQTVRHQPANVSCSLTKAGLTLRFCSITLSGCTFVRGTRYVHSFFFMCLLVSSMHCTFVRGTRYVHSFFFMCLLVTSMHA
jgi:hypothetical protein